MAVKNYKATTPGRRKMTSQDTAALTKVKPTKSLLRPRKSQAGRNAGGRITTRHRGGGVKRFYRLVDYKGQAGQSVTVKSIEYDPNRSAHIALVETAEGKPGYVLAGAGMKVGQSLKVGEDSPLVVGNRLPLKALPLGSVIYNIELEPGKGGQLVRSAGAKAQLAAKEGDYAQVKLPSGEVRMIHLDCYATLGSVGNEGHQNITWGSAGRRRRLGWRPSVKGKAMNPADHHMGGGEGKSSPGRIPKTPWGKVAIGGNTRRRKQTDKYVIRSRKRGRR